MTAIGLIFAIIYAVAGISAFVAFLILGNYPGCAWAMGTGIIGCIITQLRWLNFKNHLYQWYSSKELVPLACVGFTCFTIGAMGVTYHTAIEIMTKRPILPIDESEIIPIVWAFMTAKSGLFLMCTARMYANAEGDQERAELVLPSEQDQTDISVSVD